VQTRGLKVFETGEIHEIIDQDSVNRGVEVEIGCGNGHFLAEYASRKPDRLLIGIDRKRERCLKSAQKAWKRGLDNMQVICGRAEELFQNLPDGVIDVYHIYFPDPWPKNRHRKRRLMRMATLHQLLRTLKGGGKIHFSTDFFDYYLQTRILLALHQGFLFCESDPPQEWTASLFHQRYVERGKEIFHTSAEKSRSANHGMQSIEQKDDIRRDIEGKEKS
jgi:tRNA (guanine-N7-)-methyltransferase